MTPPRKLYLTCLWGILWREALRFFYQRERFAAALVRPLIWLLIFPLFFLSSALYPLWKMRESSELIYTICVLNPFTYAVEAIRFALYREANLQAILVVLAALAAFFLLAVLGYDPKKGMLRRRAQG